MKLTFRDLKQQKFTIEAEPSETIGQVKEKISQEKGWDTAQQKLIYSGKILQDANTVESYNIEEKGFIVCMVAKPKPAPTAASSSASAQTPVAPSAPVPSTPVAPSRTNVPSSQAQPATPSPATAGGAAAATTGATSFNDPSALAMGSQGDAVISQMESMGFPRSDIDRAMRAAFFNPDRAVEYLLNGIPENAGQEQARQQASGATQPASSAPSNTHASQPAESSPQSNEPINLFEAAAQAGQGGAGRGARQTGQAAGGATGGEGGANLSNLDFLRNNPHFQQLRQLVQQQPQMLEPILQQVGGSNPQLAQLIGQNQEQFLQLLSEDIDDDTQLPPGSQAISVTEEERDAIERLCRLGFSRDSVIQAYFACDKNEELAANFLFEQPDEENDQQQ
ncbi:hypothetical protein FQN57_003301 [Myotisia sp. PD_48]|nr:hypothetical protein FQN57_003301 [Myotisia sp. PD_48]